MGFRPGSDSVHFKGAGQRALAYHTIQRNKTIRLLLLSSPFIIYPNVTEQLRADPKANLHP